MNYETLFRIVLLILTVLVFFLSLGKFEHLIRTPKKLPVSKRSLGDQWTDEESKIVAYLAMYADFDTNLFRAIAGIVQRNPLSLRIKVAKLRIESRGRNGSTKLDLANFRLLEELTHAGAIGVFQDAIESVSGIENMNWLYNYESLNL